MDAEKIGQLILELRKNNNLTQKDLASKLGVTSQAVSKWERGLAIPDILILKQISEEFNIDISDLINGKNTSKKNNTKKFFPIFTSIILVILVILLILLNMNSKFKFSTLSSNNKDFKVEGVVAYSKDKKSIYISKVNLLDNKKEKEEYVVAECSLYEIEGNKETKISQCGDINHYNNFNQDNAHTLSYLLKDISFNVDNYKSMCKNLSSNNLYLKINAIDINNKIITYEVPLTINEDCDK